MLSCAENLSCGVTLEAVFGSWLRRMVPVVDLIHDLRFQWEIHGSSVLVTSKCQRPAGRKIWDVSHRYRTALSTSTSPRTVDPRVPPLASIIPHPGSSKDTAFVRTLMRASFRVHVRLADYAPSGEVLGHRGKGPSQKFAEACETKNVRLGGRGSRP